MEDIEDKLRDILIDALRSYFKSDLADTPVRNEELEISEEKEIPDDFNGDSKSQSNNNTDPSPTQHLAEAIPDESSQENDPDGIDLSNLFLFPETNTPLKAFSFGFKMNMTNSQPEINLPDEIGPKFMADFFKFMEQLGITPEEVAETFAEMENFAMQPEISDPPHSGQNIPVQDDLFFDVFDEDDHVLVVAEMPGMEKEEIELQVAKNEIDLNGYVIKLPAEINPDQVKAKLNNGILEIKLDKF